ncbi:MAG: hypothetical protein D6690_14495 [Nitrospirae bacterium]|nr:MAG: hypothetical protein D6690_14495 [Nitrospirota bacterium]
MSHPPALHRSQRILQAVGRRYPTLWRLVDQMRSDRGKALPAWPEWCFVPLHGIVAIISGGRQLPIDRIHHVGIVGALAAWRPTQGIYRFDPDLYRALIDTPLDRALPVEHFYHLPEWSVYIETPGMTWPSGSAPRPVHGFWTYLDWDIRRPDAPHHELRLVLDTAVTPDQALDPEHGCLSIPMILGNGTLMDALDRMAESAALQTERHGLSPITRPQSFSPLTEQLASMISLMLYLASEQPDFDPQGQRPQIPVPTKTKAGPRWFPPDQPRTWDVGLRIGHALRHAQTHTTSPETDSSLSTRARPRPHIRRAHWHTYRIGPGREAAQLKWLPPIPINLDNLDKLPATIRPVR